MLATKTGQVLVGGGWRSFLWWSSKVWWQKYTDTTTGIKTIKERKEDVVRFQCDVVYGKINKLT
jgi:hypothetical protein